MLDVHVDSRRLMSCKACCAVLRCGIADQGTDGLPSALVRFVVLGKPDAFDLGLGPVQFGAHAAPVALGDEESLEGGGDRLEHLPRPLARLHVVGEVLHSDWASSQSDC